MTLAVGVIADDFTGALDVANNLVRSGLGVVQLNGVPTDAAVPDDIDAIVVALKTRTAPVEKAVDDSLASLAWLRGHGAERIYFKYCSTFDSTPAGNIGPVIDALMDTLGVEFTIAAPAFPDTGRIVYNGTLFVGTTRLDESSMRDHPLTPMTDANVVRLLRPQSAHEVGLVPFADIAEGPGRVRSTLDALRADGVGIAVVDTVTNADLAIIAAAIADLRLVTGSSGLALALPPLWRDPRPDTGALPPATGARAIIAGSVSSATNEQVERFRGEKFAVDPLRLINGDDVATEAINWAIPRLGDAPVLIHSTASPIDITAAHDAADAVIVGTAVETALASIAVALVDAGVRQLIVAGGETSGAVVTALGVRQLRIGAQIDPGVPWAYGQTSSGGIHLALKSGNFGRPEFFTDAFGVLE